MKERITTWAEILALIAMFGCCLFGLYAYWLTKQQLTAAYNKQIEQNQAGWISGAAMDAMQGY